MVQLTLTRLWRASRVLGLLASTSSVKLTSRSFGLTNWMATSPISRDWRTGQWAKYPGRSAAMASCDFQPSSRKSTVSA